MRQENKYNPKYPGSEYCPRCGAKKLEYAKHLSRSGHYLICVHCHYSFADTIAGRWSVKKFIGTTLNSSEPIMERLNPHNL